MVKHSHMHVFVCMYLNVSITSTLYAHTTHEWVYHWKGRDIMCFRAVRKLKWWGINGWLALVKSGFGIREQTILLSFRALISSCFLVLINTHAWLKPEMFANVCKQKSTHFEGRKWKEIVNMEDSKEVQGFIYLNYNSIILIASFVLEMMWHTPAVHFIWLFHSLW